MISLPRRAVAFAAASMLASSSFAAEVVRLSERNWDKFVPQGKEVDAIYGDYVLRNDQIVVVIANPVAGRHANLTVKEVGGCIIDMTHRKGSNDQLSAFYPNAMRTPYRSISAIGSTWLPRMPTFTSRPAMKRCTMTSSHSSCIAVTRAWSARADFTTERCSTPSEASSAAGLQIAG